MTGIPSIVAGLFAYALFELFLGPGIRLGIMGSVALTVLMIPIVIRSSEEILKIVPNHLREAAYALGHAEVEDDHQDRPADRARRPRHRGDARGRADHRRDRAAAGDHRRRRLGEQRIRSTGRMQNLAVYAFNEYRNPGVDKQAAFDRAWAAALTLILIVMILNLVARLDLSSLRTDLTNVR